jgi:hypothetical protein
LWNLLLVARAINDFEPKVDEGISILVGDESEGDVNDDEAE